METATSAGSSLAEAFGFSKATKADEVWQEVRFDLPAVYLECRKGELVLETLVSIHAHYIRLKGARLLPLHVFRRMMLLAAVCC